MNFGLPRAYERMVKDLKGVVLAGGTGTRLRPLTTILNKHLLPVGKYPMIYYSIKKLREAEIREIMIVIGKQSAGLYADFLGSGAKWDVDLTFRIQEEAKGIAQGLALAEGFIQPAEKFVLLLGDNLFEDQLTEHVAKFEQQQAGAMVILKEVDDSRRYGVPVFRGDTIEKIEEKPSEPQSNYSVTGIYLYDGGVFDVIKRMEPSKRGEMEITDVNNFYAKQGSLTYGFLQKWWTDAGTFESLKEAGKRIDAGNEEV